MRQMEIRYGRNRPKALLIASAASTKSRGAFNEQSRNRPKALLIASAKMIGAIMAMGAFKSQSPEGSSYRFSSYYLKNIG